MTKARVIEIMNELLEYVGNDRLIFSHKIGESSAQWIADVLNPKKNVGISRAKILKICQVYPEIDMAYLTSGEGALLKYDSFVKSREDDERLQTSEPETPYAGNRKTPVYDGDTTGGNTDVVSSSNEISNLVGYINSGDWFERKETAIIRHVGESMIEYPDGCWLAVKRVLNPKLLVPGKNYVIETDEFRVTKRIQKGSEKGYIKLYSTNQERYEDGQLIHEPFEIHLSDVRRIFSVLGYVVNQSGEIKLFN